MTISSKLSLSKLLAQNKNIDFLSIGNVRVTDWIEVDGNEIDENRKQRLIRLDTFDRNLYFSPRSHIIKISNCVFEARDIEGQSHKIVINIPNNT